MSLSVGSSIALASRSTIAQTKLLRLPALWALVALELILAAPLGAYLLWRFPSWSLMYLLPPGSLPMPEAALAAGCPLVAVLTFVVARRLLIKRRLGLVTGILLGGLGVAALIAYLGRAQLSVIGTVEAFRADPTAMRSVLISPLPYVAASALGALVIGWLATLWRVWLLARGARLPGERTVAPTVVQPKAPKRKAGTRKKGA